MGLTVKLRGKRVVDIDDNNLPVSLTLIQESHHTENLDLLDLTNIGNLLTNLNDIEGIVVSTGLGLGMLLVGVFPGLQVKSLLIFGLYIDLFFSLTWGRAP